MPILSSKLKIHDAILMAVFASCEAVSSFLKPLAASLWQYYLFHILGILGYCKFAIIRSLLSKSIGADEVGKFFSLLALVSSVGPLIGSPAFRQLYNFTLNFCPGMSFYVSAGLTALAAAANVLIYFKREHLRQFEQNNNEGEEGSC